MWHNETINIWSHLIPLLFTMMLFAYISISERYDGKPSWNSLIKHLVKDFKSNIPEMLVLE